jgi:uncharacterized membrane protein
MTSAPSSRLAYIDWLRGLACVLMFQTHCYDAWLGGSARNSTFLMYSQLGGTFPAPLFLFLAGISFAMVTKKLMQKDLPANEIARKTIRRGAEILALGLLFRLQEYLIALGWAPWSDLFRVDILSTIGASMMLMGVMCWAVLEFVNETRSPGGPRPVWAGEGTHSTPSFQSVAQGRLRAYVDRGGTGALARAIENPLRPRASLTLVALLTAIAITAVTPLLWTTWRPRFLPWELETYVNGVHNLGQPQAALFPIFPWTAFAFAGLAFGFILTGDYAQKLGWRLFAIGGLAGVAFYYVAKFCDARPWQIYPVFDFWHTSPEFFLMRVGFLLLFVLGAYVWCRWGLGQKGFSPLIQLGNTSLLVYWVHIELVYGKFAILPHRSQGIAGASTGLLIIFLLMLALSLVRTAWKSHADRVLLLAQAVWGRAPRPSGRA